MAKKPTYEELEQRVKEVEKEALEHKRMSKKKYGSLVEATSDWIWEVDNDGVYTYTNSKIKDILGYEPREIIGKTPFDFMLPNDQKRLSEWFKDILESRKPFEGLENTNIHKDGRHVLLETSGVPVFDTDGNLLGYRGIDRDISRRKLAEKALQKAHNELERRVEGRTAELISANEKLIQEIGIRKQAEKALKESEEFLETVVENIPDMIFVKDAKELRFVRFNKAGEDLLGHSRKDLIGKNDYDFFPKEEADFFTGKDREVLDKGTFFDIPEEPIKTKYKGERILHTKKIPLLDEKGQPEYLLGISEDITERKRLVDQLQRAQKLEAIGTLAGGVAHDLNNILGGLVSYPELLLLQLPEDSPLRKSILTIQKSGEKAAAVVQDLLTLARRGVVVTEVVNLNDVIAEYLKSPEHENLQSYHPGIHLETHLDQNILNILGSSTHLSKTIMNLVSNAAEAMPDGGKLTVSAENRYIDRPIRGYDDVKEGDYVVLAVSDTGTGISPDDIGKIFEPFYTKKKMGRSGTGLGMAVVWGTVKDHNGYIDVQSIEGQGTTFTLYFPVTRKELPEDKSHLTIESYRGSGKSILIVDDVEEQRKIASGMLKELGYSVMSVSSGEEAVEYLRTNKVDLLVLDMIMDPGMDGLDTYKKIIDLHPGQKAIIASGFSETDRVKEVQDLGAGTYIKKPYTLEKVGVAVKDELEK